MLHGLLIGSLAAWYFTAAPRLWRAPTACACSTCAATASASAPPSGYDVGVARRRPRRAAPATSPRRSPSSATATARWSRCRFALAHPERVRAASCSSRRRCRRRTRSSSPRSSRPRRPAPPAPSNPGPTTRSPADLLDALPRRAPRAGPGGSRQAQRLLRSLEYLACRARCSPTCAPSRPRDAVARAARLPTLCVYGDRSACAPAGERLAPACHPRRPPPVLPGGHFLHLDARAALHLGARRSTLDG